jgi:hypothetical protein
VSPADLEELDRKARAYDQLVRDLERIREAPGVSVIGGWRDVQHQVAFHRGVDTVLGYVDAAIKHAKGEF